MTDTERLNWIMDKIDSLAAGASALILDHLAIGDSWRLKPHAPDYKKMRAQWRVEIDKAVAE